MENELKQVSNCCKTSYHIDDKKTQYIWGRWLVKEYYVCDKCNKPCELDIIEHEK